MTSPLAKNLDPVELAFDNAKPLDEPISDDELRAIDEARAAGDEGLTAEELLAKLRPGA